MATEKDVRRIALSLPETTEKPWFNAPGFRVKDKGFLRIRSEAEGGLVVFVADLGEKEALLQSDPKKFFTTPHYDGYPTVLVNLKAVGVRELRELIIESWRCKAPNAYCSNTEISSPGDPPPGPWRTSRMADKNIKTIQKMYDTLAAATWRRSSIS